MDLSILRRKISTFRSEGGKLRKVSDELLMELLQSWENWPGPANGFYSALGLNHKKLAVLIGRAKKLKQEGFGVTEFKEIQIEAQSMGPNLESQAPCSGVEIVWNNGRIIRFSQVDLLVEFLKKAA